MTDTEYNKHAESGSEQKNEFHDDNSINIDFTESEADFFNLIAMRLTAFGNFSLCHINSSNARLPLFLMQNDYDTFRYTTFCRNIQSLSNAQMDYGIFNFKFDLLAIDAKLALLEANSDIPASDCVVLELYEDYNEDSALIPLALSKTLHIAIISFHLTESNASLYLEKLSKNIVSSGINPTAVTLYSSGNTNAFIITK